MAKYLVLWEINPDKAPVDPKERGAAWIAMANMVKQDMKDGKITDWGLFAGESDKGFNVSSMTEVELSKSLQRYYPYVTFKVSQILSIDQAIEVAKSLTG
jgi:hypothetical protein